MAVKIIEYTSDFAGRLSEIIIRNLIEINSKDYPLEEMKRHALSFSPEKIEEYSKNRKIYVAAENGDPVGTLGILRDERCGGNEYFFLTIFVLPEKHGCGIGRLLMEKGEEYVKSLKGRKITIPSSITSHGFYHKIGYSYADKTKEPNKEGMIIMIKQFVEL